MVEAIRAYNVVEATLPDEGVKLMDDEYPEVEFDDTSNPEGAETTKLAVKLEPETVKDCSVEGVPSIVDIALIVPVAVKDGAGGVGSALEYSKSSKYIKAALPVLD